VPSRWHAPTRAQRRDALLALALLLVCGWLYLAGHARYGLFDVDEGIFTQATLEMRESGSLAMPTYNGEPRYHKPPLIYWAQDAAMAALGGHSLYAARLPSAVSALLTLALLGGGVWFFSRDRRWALLATAAMALNLSFLVVGRAATADGLLNLTSLALALWVVHVCFPVPLAAGEAREFSIVRMAERMQRVRRLHAYWAWQWTVTALLAALGFLAKGPVAWAPAAFVAAALLLARRDRAATWRRLAPFKVLALTLALLAPWVALLVHTHGLGFFYEFFIVHNLGRYVGGMGNTQSHSPFYYLLVLVLGFFPWVLVLPGAFRQALRGSLRGVRASLAAPDPARALPALCLVWAVAYIGFFSLSQTKLAHYIVPAYPALAVLAGWHLSRVPRPRMSAWMAGAGVALAVLMALLLLVLNPLLQGLRQPVLEGWLGWLQAVVNFEWPPRDPLAMAVLHQKVPLDAAPWLLGGLLLLVAPAWWMAARARRGAWLLLAGLWALVLAVVVWGLVPMVWRYTQAPLARLAAAIGAAPPGTPVVHLGLHKPTVLYLSGRPFLKLENPLQLPGYLTRPETLVLTEEPTVPAIGAELAAQGGSEVVGAVCDGGFCLLTVARLPLNPLDARGIYQRQSE